MFEEKGFTVAPLNMVHTGMGTGGRYTFFYHILLEFLYPHEEATFDTKYKTLFSHKDDWRETSQSLCGLAVTMALYDTMAMPFKTTEVKEAWMVFEELCDL